MRVLILGPLTVVDGDRTIAVGGRKETVVLTLLALEANRVVSEDRLIEAVWLEDPPRTAQKSLHNSIARIRKALGSTDELAVETQRPGYRLRARSDLMDLGTAERLIDDGRSARDRGANDEASALFREALGLWRGRALVDVADNPTLTGEVVRLEELYQGTLEDRLEADLALGLHQEIVGELEALVLDHPLRERLWRQLALALYRCGRQAEALRSFQRARTTLVEQLGIEPGPELRALEQAVIRQDAVLDVQPLLPPASGALATFLFTDIVGSTDLWECRPKSMRAVVARHDVLLAEAITAHGGVVFKSMGDGLCAVFPEPRDALLAAESAQRAMAEEEWDGIESLSVRMAVYTGYADRERGDWFGPPLNRCARLLAVAHGGQILVSEPSGRSIGVDLGEGRHLVDLGRHQLRGVRSSEHIYQLAGPDLISAFPPLSTGLDPYDRPEPSTSATRAVAAAPVDGEPIRVSTVPLPALLTDMGSIFVGREAELDRLHQLWKEAAVGERRLVLLGGEPGVGKTRLSAELAFQVREDGGLVLAGRCEQDLGVPYQPFVEAMRHYADHTPAPDLRARLGRYAGELARLVPELADTIPDLPQPAESDPDTERYRLFGAIASWLASISLREPVLLVLDDLQWAAKPTLLLLRHIARSSELKRVLVLGTYRDSELRTGDDLSQVLADLRRESGVERLSLTGLDSDAVAAFVQRASGHDLDDDFAYLARAIHADTDGNPFFVREVLGHLGEIGVLDRRNWRARGGLPFGIPDGVREVVAQRVACLSEVAKTLLEVAAVAGADFDLAVIGEAEPMDEAQLMAGLDEALRARLILESGAPDPRFRFTHALVRDTLYQELSGPRRAAFHKRIAKALEVVHAGDLSDHLPALIYNWSRAGVPAAETRRIVDYAAQAGDQALTQLAYEEATSYYRQALGLLPEGPDDAGRRLNLLICLGDAERRSGEPAHRQTLLDAARLAQERGDGEALARAALANSRGILPSFSAIVDQEQVGVLEAAIAATGARDDAVKARLLAALALEMVFGLDMERPTRLADEALALARRVGDTATLAGVLISRYWTVPWAPLSERTSDADEALALADQLRNPTVKSWALSLRFRAATEGADPSEAARCFHENEALVAELREPGLQWVVAVQRAGRALFAGQFERAERLASDAFELGLMAGQRDAQLFYTVELGALRFEQGRTAELVDALDEMTRRYPRSPIFRPLSALALWEAGQPDRARSLLEAEAAEDFLHVMVEPPWLASLCLFAALASALGDVARARVLTDRLAPYALQCPTLGHGGVVLGSTSHYLGLLATILGRYDEAEQHFTTASAMHQRLAAPAWSARTDLEWARMLLLRGEGPDLQRAHTLLDAARHGFDSLGLTAWRDRSEAIRG